MKRFIFLFMGGANMEGSIVKNAKGNKGLLLAGILGLAAIAILIPKNMIVINVGNIDINRKTSQP
jgi:hypothetical protein